MRLNVINPHAPVRRVPGAPAAPVAPRTPAPVLKTVKAQAAAPAQPAPSTGGFFAAIVDSFKIFYETYVPMRTRQVENDPADVNHPDGMDQARAKSDTAANRAAEQEAIAKLGSDDRARYQAVAKLAGDDPIARRALQQMLLDGRLTGEKALVGDGNLLAQLAGLAGQDVAQGIDRGTLVCQVLAELQNPVRINQQNKGTCAATTAQILLARRHPAEYVRLVAGLAAPAGSVAMAGGGTLRRDPDWANNNDGERTTSSRLFQPAVMNASEGFPGETYHNTNDKPYLGPIPLPFGGMTPGGSSRVNTQLEGVKYKNLSFMFGNRMKKFEAVKAAIAAGYGSVPVGVMWNADGVRGGHELQVDKVDGGRVYYTNPWGQTESMDEQEFVDHLTSASVPQG